MLGDVILNLFPFMPVRQKKSVQRHIASHWEHRCMVWKSIVLNREPWFAYFDVHMKLYMFLCNNKILTVILFYIEMHFNASLIRTSNNYWLSWVWNGFTCGQWTDSSLNALFSKTTAICGTIEPTRQASDEWPVHWGSWKVHVSGPKPVLF